MAINFDKIKAEYERINNPDAGKYVSPWAKLENGDQIRILPASDGEPIKSYYVHFNYGLPFACPKRNFGKPCPLCDLADELKNSDDPAQVEKASEMWAKRSHYVIVAIRGKEEEGPKIWSFSSKGVHKDLIGTMMDEDYGDITDVDTGNDIKIVKTKATNQKWASTSIMPKPKGSLAKSINKQTLSDDVIKKLVEEQPVVSEFVTKLSKDEIVERIREKLNPQEEEQTGTTKDEIDSFFESDKNNPPF